MAHHWITFIVLGLTACSAATPTPKQNAVASSFAAPSNMLADYHTFSFGLADPPKTGYDVTPRSLEVSRRLQPLVLGALKERGYSEAANQADFVVKLSAGTGAPLPRATRGAEDGGHGDGVPVSDIARGFIGINIYDSASGSQVWQGTAFAEIDPDHIDDALLQMGVAHMLASFPSKKPLLTSSNQ